MNVQRIAPVLVVCLLLGGCAALGGRQSDCDCSAPTGQTDQRHRLNEGYSLLYSAADGLSKVDLVFLTKVESDDVQAVVQDISDYAGELTAKLEKVDQDFPAVDIHLDPLPEMEKREIGAAGSDRLLSFAPVVGRTGANFERTLLLTLSGTLNQERFLARVMAKDEPNAALKQILGNAERHYAQLYERVVKLLNERYFKQNTYQPPNDD